MELSNKLISLCPQLQLEPYNIPLKIDSINELPQAIKIRAQVIADFDKALKIIKLDGVNKEEAEQILLDNEWEEVEEGDTDVSEVWEARVTGYQGA